MNTMNTPKWSMVCVKGNQSFTLQFNQICNLLKLADKANSAGYVVSIHQTKGNNK